MLTPRWFALVLAALLAAAGPALAKNPPSPGGTKQPLEDGCQRSDFGIGFNTSPEWVYVNRNPAVRRASGIVRVPHAAVDDAPLQHVSFDYNGNLAPDRASSYLMAGRRTGTNNFAGERAGNASEEFRRLHFEWESGTLPFYAWPADGDRATMWGSWIWDCGHWTNVENNAEGAKVTGEHTELHPLNGIAVTRSAPYAARGNESQTDVFISNDGNGARAVEKCALAHKPKDDTTYDDGFKPCAEKKANRLQPLAKTYKFFVPAPRKPKGAGKLRYRVVNQARSSGSQRVHVGPRGLDVTVKLKNSFKTVQYGKSFFVSWASDKAKPETLKITIESILIKQADPNPQRTDKSPPTWAMWMHANGYWNGLNDWAPGLSGVTDGEVVPVNKSFRITVPKGQGVWFEIHGHECDVPADTMLFGQYVPIMRPCGPNRDDINPEVLLLLLNDAAGIVLDRYKSASAAIGSHVSLAKQTQTFPGSGPITFGHGFESEGTYEVRYSVARG